MILLGEERTEETLHAISLSQFLRSSLASVNSTSLSDLLQEQCLNCSASALLKATGCSFVSH